MTTEQEMTTREGWDAYREVRMQEIQRQVEELLEMHERYGDSLQKDYLYKSRRALIDGLGWFDWARKRKAYGHG